MKGIGVAVAGAVLAAGVAGGSAFAAKPFPRNLPNNSRPPAAVRHCEQLTRHIADLAHKQKDAKNDHQKQAIQRQLDQERQHLLKVCT